MGVEEWGTFVLGDLCQITSSKRIFAEEYVDVGIPFYRSKEVIEKALGEDITLDLFIPKERFYVIKKSFGAPQTGDILISSVGNRSGIPYLVKDDDGDFYFKDGNVIWFKDFNNKLNSKYLSYWLKSSLGQNALDSIMIGSAQKALTIIGISGLSITLPHISVQEQTANILSSLDNKIEVNRRMNDTLESMARAVFRQWFVENKEVGNWEIGPLGNLVTLINERVDATPDKDNEKYIALEDMPSKSIDLSKYRLGSEVNSSITKFQKGDILFGSMRPYFHKVGVAPYDGITRTTTFTLRPKQNELRAFALYWLFSDDVIDFSTTASIGTTIPYVRWETLEKYEIPIPPNALIKKFNDFFQPLWLKIVANGKESRTLGSLRDSLLPKLMRGEVRVKDLN